MNISFSLFAGFLGLWAASIYFYEHPIFFTSTTWIKIVYLMVLIMIAPILYFSSIFPQRIVRSLKLLLIGYFVPAGVFAYILFFTDLWVKSTTISNGQLQTLVGPAYIYFGIFSSLSGVLLFVNFARNYFRVKGIRKMQLAYLFVGLFLYVTPTIIVDVVFPLVKKESGYFWTSAFFSIFFIITVSYAIIKHRLMDIRVIIRQSMVFITSGIIAIGSGSWLSYWVDKYLTLSSWGGDIIGITCAIILIMPLKKGLQSLANRYLFTSLYSFERTIKELAKKLVTILDLKQLAKTIVEEMMKIMHLDKATVLLRNGPSGQVFQIIHLVGFHEENGISLVKDNFLTQWLQKNKRPLVYEELQLMIRDQQNPAIKKHLEILKANMKRIEANVCLPLISKDGILGLIVLGNKMSGEAYSQQDIELLEVLTAQASIAIQNSRLYQEVHDLTHNLQEKVDEQTQHIKKLFRVKTEFLHLVSHQLRTPLTALRGLLSMWSEGAFETYSQEEKQKIKERIQISCERLNNITNDMLDTLDVEEGYVRFKFEPLDITQTINEILELLKPNFDKKQLYIKISKPDKPLPKIQADKQYLPQALQNIIDNAEKYTKQGGLTISFTQPTPDQVRISFKDTGIGINSQEQAHLFREKFFRGQQADRIHTAGSGLGLYIVKYIIDGHQGTIETKSQGRGKGAEFLVTLPILQTM